MLSVLQAAARSGTTAVLFNADLEVQLNGKAAGRTGGQSMLLVE